MIAGTRLALRGVPALARVPGVRVAGADRRIPAPRSVAATAIVFALCATVFSLVHGWPAMYNDAAAHLDIARRISDGLTPGLAQVGSVWLPLPQLLMAPLASIDWLWHSGLAGALVSGAAFVYSSVRIFSLAEELTGRRLAGWATLVVWITNLNLLYLQTTPLDEMVMLACTVGAAYHLTRWMRTFAVSDLAFAAVITLLGTLTRYDAWALFIAELAVVALWTKLRQHRDGIVQANVVVMLAIGGYGICLWFLYNLVIFHDALYFLHSTYSAQAQQLQQLQIGFLPTKGHLATSAATLGWAIVDVAGVATVIAGLAGAGLLLVRRRPELFRNAAVLCLLLAPVALNLVTLVAGQTTIRVPQLPPLHLFNTRYGLEAMPFLAVCAGSLAAYVRGRLMVVPVLAALYTAATMAVSTPITVAEGMRGDAVANASQESAVAAYLGAHYRGGLVLADDSLDSPMLFRSGLHLADFVTIGFHPMYEQALAHPAGNVRWVVVFKGDAIDGAMRAHPGRFAGFTPVFRSAPLTVYTARAAPLAVVSH